MPQYIELLNSFLANPAFPCWSSNALKQMFADVEGDARQRLLNILPLIDDQLHTANCDLTSDQAHFLRDVTLHVVPGNVMTIDQISWLIERFRTVPSQQRALMIALLVRLDELPAEIRSTILKLLKETPGDRYIVGEQQDNAH